MKHHQTKDFSRNIPVLPMKMGALLVGFSRLNPPELKILPTSRGAFAPGYWGRLLQGETPRRFERLLFFLCFNMFPGTSRYNTLKIIKKKHLKKQTKQTHSFVPTDCLFDCSLLDVF